MGRRSLKFAQGDTFYHLVCCVLSGGEWGGGGTSEL